MTAVVPSPRPALELEQPAADRAPFLRPLTELDAELDDCAVKIRQHLAQIAGSRRALEIAETRRRRLLAARAATTAAIALEQLLDA